MTCKNWSFRSKWCNSSNLTRVKTLRCCTAKNISQSPYSLYTPIATKPQFHSTTSVTLYSALVSFYSICSHSSVDARVCARSYLEALSYESPSHLLPQAVGHFFFFQVCSLKLWTLTQHMEINLMEMTTPLGCLIFVKGGKLWTKRQQEYERMTYCMWFHMQCE